MKAKVMLERIIDLYTSPNLNIKYWSKITIENISWSLYTLPMRQPLTTSSLSTLENRKGYILKISIRTYLGN